MVYTPQMIINGEDHVVGNRPQDVEILIGKHQDRGPSVSLHVARSGERITVKAQAEKSAQGAYVVQLIRYRPQEDVRITRGENAGRTLSYANIVTDLDVLATWDGRAPLELEAAMAGQEPGVIVIQGRELGPVIAAARVR